jgi:hypothetical protein
MLSDSVTEVSRTFCSHGHKESKNDYPICPSLGSIIKLSAHTRAKSRKNIGLQSKRAVRNSCTNGIGE